MKAAGGYRCTSAQCLSPCGSRIRQNGSFGRKADTAADGQKHPVEIERLLVVTFTNAAAAEMRNESGRGLIKTAGGAQKTPGGFDKTSFAMCTDFDDSQSVSETIREHFEVLNLILPSDLAMRRS